MGNNTFLNIAIDIQSLSKRFGHILAVGDVNLEVYSGEIFGLLGPNAAGKSTIIKIATTLLEPDYGTIIVDNQDVTQEPERVRAITGLLPEDGADTHYNRLSAYQNLEYFGRLYKVPKEQLDARINNLLDFFEMSDLENRSPATFSTGLKQKLSIARALINDPPIIFLDEPTSSLDPIMAKKIRGLIKKKVETGHHTFFICTHLLSEAELICNRVAFLSRGQIVEVGSPKELRQKIWTDRLFQVKFSGAEKGHVKEIINSTGLVKEAEIENESVIFVVEKPELKNHEILKALSESNVRVLELRERIPNLEDIYFKVIGGD